MTMTAPAALQERHPDQESTPRLDNDAALARMVGVAVMTGLLMLIGAVIVAWLGVQAVVL